MLANSLFYASFFPINYWQVSNFFMHLQLTYIFNIQIRKLKLFLDEFL
jgi:hypothetical protein